MICHVCDRPCTQYDIFRVACKNGHIWTLPQFADMPIPPVDLKPSAQDPVRLVKAPAYPAWLFGAALGGVALLVSLLEVIL